MSIPALVLVDRELDAIDNDWRWQSRRIRARLLAGDLAQPEARILAVNCTRAMQLRKHAVLAGTWQRRRVIAP